MKSVFYQCALFAAIIAAGGCAPKNHSVDEDGAFDPIEPINRNIYGFNKKVDFFLMRPVAKGYDHFMPRPLKKPVDNFLSNLGEPSNIANHILQKNGDNAVRSSARLVFNSVFGLGGLFDVAGKMGIEEHDTDFGSTIRAYSYAWSGRQPGYIVAPLLGPSSLPDIIGGSADAYTKPDTYLESNQVKFYISGVRAVDARAQFLDSEGLIELSLDEYSFVRDFREELRQKESFDDDLWGEPENIWDK